MAQETKSSQTGLWVGAAAFVVVAAVWGAILLSPNPIQVGTPLAVVAPERSAVERAPLAEPVVETALDEEPETKPADSIDPADAPPSFDVVRVEPSGATVIAGQGTPGEVVDILLDGDVVARATVDNAGRFAILQQFDPSADPQALSLSSGKGDARVSSTEEILLAPRPEPDDVVAETTSTPAPQTVLKADDDGIEVVQPGLSPTAPPEIIDAVALDTITYAPSGEVSLGGRASTDFVRIYIDDAPIMTAPVEADGQWRTALPDVDTGVYTLRIDEIDAEGGVASRVETPFKREDRETVAAEIGETAEARIRVKTVQPGNTLWAIASERYGDGLLYVRVFEANRDRIRNPDLIYPGQVFTIPD